MKQVIQLDHQGYFVGTTEADPDPLDPGSWLMPARTIDAPLPDTPNGMIAKWNGAWEYESIPEISTDDAVAESPIEPLTTEQQQILIDTDRRLAYAAESDPLFFKAQRGEATMEQWLAKIQEIKDRYPNVSGDQG